MQILNRAYNFVTQNFKSAAQKTGGLIVSTKELKDNPYIFQKVCQVAFSIILAINLSQGGKLLSKLTATLMSTAGIHNFLGFLKLPYEWLYSVNIDTIDDIGLHKNLTMKLNRINGENLARGAIINLLEEMEAKDIAFRNVGEFKKALEKKLKKFIPKTIPPVADVKLGENFKVPLKKLPLGEIITNISFSSVDLMCIPLYLQGWNVNFCKNTSDFMKYMGLEAQAQSFGQSKVFQWAQSQDLSKITWGLCSLSYALQVYESIRQLRDEKLNKNQRDRMELRLIAASVELILSTAGFIKASQAWMVSLTIITKTIGILSIACRPGMSFVERPEEGAK